MEMFCEALEFCALSGIYTKGPKFTWTNNRRDRGFTREKLDRAIANMEWHQSFSNSLCTVLPAVRSDHNPLFIVAIIKDSRKKGYGVLEEDSIYVTECKCN
ncbi:hypothetical protein I3842_01G071200 [Carya illinoinensis]|uniref:Uncharacterized protein n=1 Tax=Carya illinoinensis TaxID=32201 RepID=A0A922K650_CARIL|nr:hypothetical protein I3842_01G071200 [Carya illinoinensis]